MDQTGAIVIAAIVIVITFASFIVIPMNVDSMLIGIGVPVVLVVVAIFTSIWAFDDNYYHVESGIVIAQDFDPAHWQSTGKSAYYVVDDWAIEVQSNEHTGWIHFDEDVFYLYPIGSEYPAQQ